MDSAVLQDSLFYLEEPQVTFTAPSGAYLVWIQGANSSGDAAVLRQCSEPTSQHSKLGGSELCANKAL